MSAKARKNRFATVLIRFYSEIKVVCEVGLALKEVIIHGDEIEGQIEIGFASREELIVLNLLSIHGHLKLCLPVLEHSLEAHKGE